MNSYLLFAVLIGLLSPAVHGFKLRQADTNEDPDDGPVTDGPVIDEPPPTGPVTCPAGNRGPGGTCECERAAAWVEGKCCNCNYVATKHLFQRKFFSF